MASFKHNKKRNAGLVYEFLVRRAGSQMVDQDPAGFERTVEITKKYFSEGQPLAEELELFKTIRDTRGCSEAFARKVLGEVARQASRANLKLLEIKKSNLIKDLHYSFGQDFFSKHRIPEYRLLATVQLFLDGVRGKQKLSESVKAMQLEDVLVKWMTTNESLSKAKGLDEQVDSLVCTMVARKFGEKYGNALNAGQKVLLERYVKSLVTEDQSLIQRKLVEDRKNVLKLLESHQHEKAIQDDKVMRDRFFESVNKLASLDLNQVNEEVVEEMMLFHKLAEELQSNE